MSAFLFAIPDCLSLRLRLWFMTREHRHVPSIRYRARDEFLHVALKVGLAPIVYLARRELRKLLAIVSNLVEHSVFGCVEC
jgi:hypothetical protein